MVTLPSGIVPLFLRLTRANAAYRTAAGARRHLRRNELRPARYGPPRRLRPDVRVDVRADEGHPVYTVSPTRRRARGGVVYAHGGGWVNEVAPEHWTLAAQIAAEVGTTVTLPIYPLVPFGVAEKTVPWFDSLVRSSFDRYGPTCLAGDSAGGQIALSTALSLRDRHGIALPATVLIAPSVDLSFSNPRIPAVQPTDPWLGTDGARVFTDLWRGELAITDPTVSPLFGDLAGLGPLTVFTGTRDILNPDAHLLREKAERAGVTVDFHERMGQLHVYPLLPTEPGREARRAIVAALAHGMGPVATR